MDRGFFFTRENESNKVELKRTNRNFADMFSVFQWLNRFYKGTF